MGCHWQELLSILPQWLAVEIRQYEDACLQELRLRIHRPPELIVKGNSKWLRRDIIGDDLQFCVNAASRYSPWAAASVSQGYLTAPGGHRIGICGEAVVKDGKLSVIRQITSLNIRVARDFPGIARRISCRDNTLIIGAPGSGKTTLLRDLIRQLSNRGERMGVVDERGELFPSADFPPGNCTDVLSGCGKEEGIGVILRTMGPNWIAVDEITAKSDCDALIRCGWCGVRLLATAHAASVRDLKTREVYRPLIETGLFSSVIVLNSDKTWTQERMELCNTNGSERS